MRLRPALLALVALAVAGCGGGPSAQEVLSETAANLGKIRSGDVSLRLVVAAKGGEQAGFELEGPLALAEEGKLPVAEVEYTQIAGEESSTVTFLSTGERAFVEVAGETYELPAEQVEELRGGGGGTAAGGLGAVEIEDWFEDPELSDGGEVGGADTDRISARLNVVNAANDLVEIARQLGGSDLQPLEGASAEQLERAIESARIEVFTGADDRLLRRLVIDAELRAEVPPEVEEALGTFGGARFSLDLTIADPNRPVSVQEPEDAEPFPGG